MQLKWVYRNYDEITFFEQTEEKNSLKYFYFIGQKKNQFKNQIFRQRDTFSKNTTKNYNKKIFSSNNFNLRFDFENFQLISCI